MANSAQLNSEIFYTLQQAAEILKVSAETLIEWNENNILKPTITQGGIVVYKREQIGKFLIAQQLLKDGKNNFVQKNIINNADSQINNSHITQNNKETAKGQLKISSNKFKYISTAIFFLFIIVSSTLYKKTNIINPLVDDVNITSPTNNINLEKDLKIQTNPGNLSSANKIGTESNNSDNSNNKLRPDMQEEGFSSLTTVFEKNPASDEANTKEEVQTVSLAENINKHNILNNLSNDERMLLDSLASKPNNDGVSPKISSETESLDPLAINLGKNGLNGNEIVPETKTFPNIVLVFLSLGLMSSIFIFKYQFSYADLQPSTNTIPLNKTSKPDDKLFEIDQKTDGTVVMYLQGKELKISKPELNSESDQFINRLLEYAPRQIKEINYNILKDEKINLNAPLSKLVTRLGFVGTKRDLFFPRTSKNSVLFRRYITKEDLKSMSLSTDQVANEFVN